MSHGNPAPVERDPAVAQERRALFKQYFPEWEAHFRALYELGMVPGWRAIVRLEVKSKNPVSTGFSEEKP